MSQPPIAVMAQHGFTSLPVPHLVFRPGDPGGAKANVYTDWHELYAALQESKNQGIRYLQFDNRFAPPSPTGVPPLNGFHPCLIPAGGPYDMEDVVWINSAFTDAGELIEFEDGCQIVHFAWSKLFVGHWWFNGTSGVPVFDLPAFPNTGWGIFFDSSFLSFRNSNPLATPMFRLAPAPSFNVFVFNKPFLGGIGPCAAPIIDVNGALLGLVVRGGTIFNNVFKGSGQINLNMKGPAFDGESGNLNVATWSQPNFTGIFNPIFGYTSARHRTPAVLSAPGNLTVGDIQRVNSSGGPVTVTLPSASILPRIGMMIRVKDVGGQAAVNPITVAVPAGNSLDGVLNGTHVISAPYGAASFFMDGVGTWWTL